MSQATRDAKREEIKAMQAGQGKFLMCNNTQSEIHLPKASLDPSPKIQVPARGTFIGDSYHKKHLGGLVSIIQVIDPGNEESQTFHESLDSKSGEIKPISLGTDFTREVQVDRSDPTEINRAAYNLGEEIVCQPGQEAQTKLPPAESFEDLKKIEEIATKNEPQPTEPSNNIDDDDDVIGALESKLETKKSSPTTKTEPAKAETKKVEDDEEDEDDELVEGEDGEFEFEYDEENFKGFGDDDDEEDDESDDDPDEDEDDEDFLD